MFINDILIKIFNVAREYLDTNYKMIKLTQLDKNVCNSFNPFAK